MTDGNAVQPGPVARRYSRYTAIHFSPSDGGLFKRGLPVGDKWILYKELGRDYPSISINKRSGGLWIFVYNHYSGCYTPNGLSGLSGVVHTETSVTRVELVNARLNEGYYKVMDLSERPRTDGL